MPEINKIKKLGFIVDNLSANQLAYHLIRSGNEVSKISDKCDICAFYRNLAPYCIKPEFGIFTLFDCFSFSGITISTDLQSAQSFLRWPGPNKFPLYFYLNSLEWLNLRNMIPYEQLAQIYLNPKLNLIARSQSHKEIIEACWKPVYGIVENCDVKKFLEIL